MNLVIVESPAKAKTIEKYLGRNFKVVASYGHIRDLPEKELGINVAKDFKPYYVIPYQAKKRVAFLKKAAEKADELYLATDPDREGEAIAWHITEAIKPIQRPKRIVFHEITKEAIFEAIKKPRGIDLDLVDAQQARRILDRLVGYKLSPLLWKKVAKGLSAGRVQSVAVRLIVDREREIQAFKPEEYWTIVAEVKPQEFPEQPEAFLATLTHIGKQKLEKLDIKNQQQAEEIKLDLEKASYQVKSVETKETFRYPAPPFTTSTLQMDASRKLGFTAKKTMFLAQQLYEGVELGKEGSTGLITYMRTDSVNLAESALREILSTVRKRFGKEFAVSEPRRFKTKTRGAQEAHEAIRPTQASRTPELVKEFLEPDQFRLYELIWKRTMATQMTPAKFESTSVDIEAKSQISNSKPQIYTLHATGSRLIFPGFIKVYTESHEDHEHNETEEKFLPKLVEGQKLDLSKILTEQHFTEPPPRYSEATLVKALEEQGIGRPSTYAPIMSTIQERGYVRKEGKYFHPNDIGIVVNDLLVKHFPNIVDIKFTAHMEEKLDEIAEGKIGWVRVVREFYEPFEKELKKKTEEIKKSEVMPAEATKEICKKCGKPMFIRLGRYGKFLACSGFPECKNIKPLKTAEIPLRQDAKVEVPLQPQPDETSAGAENLPIELAEKLSQKCEKCGGEMILRKGKYGKFLGCSNYPKCKNIINIGKAGFTKKKR
jgi:DNA topoisomerase-1